MDPPNPFGAKYPDRLFDSPGNGVLALDFVVFDINDADAERDLRLEVFESLQFTVAAASELQKKMVAFQ